MKRRNEKKVYTKRRNKKRALLESILEAETSIAQWNRKIYDRARHKRDHSAKKNIDGLHFASPKETILKMKNFDNSTLNQPGANPMSPIPPTPAMGEPFASARKAVQSSSALAKVQRIQRQLAERFLHRFLRYQKFFSVREAYSHPVLIPARTSDAILSPIIQSRVRVGATPI